MKIEMKLEGNIEKPERLLNIILSGMNEENTPENQDAIIKGILDSIQKDIKSLMISELETRVIQIAAEYDMKSVEKIVGCPS